MPRVDFSTMPEPLVDYPWEVMLEQGFHWMDRYGEAHWIEDMSEAYLENALRYAQQACWGIASSWYRFAMALGGDMAVMSAESQAARFEDLDLPLVKGLKRALAIKRGEEYFVEDWELEGDWDFNAAERHAGYTMMGVYEVIQRDFEPMPETGGMIWKRKEV